jgi:Fe-S-cluster containining protein
MQVETTVALVTGGRMQRTCCQTAEILVTTGDEARIHDHLVLQSTKDVPPFAERRVPSDAAYLEDDAEDPRWKLLTVAADSTRRMLLRKANEDCHFLGAAGCVLPTEVRPLVCRIYPWAYDQRGLLNEESEYCPKAALQPPGGSMTRMLDIPAAQAEGWRTQLYAELESDLRQRTEAEPSCASH